MKKFSQVVQNIAWICKPFWQYGKRYIILSIFILGLYSPIDDIVYVKSPEIMINLLSAGKSFSYIGIAATMICGISFLNNAVRVISRGYFTRKQTEIDLRLNQDIYEKAMQLDYKYIDNPQYYDSYAWTVSEYAAQVKKGRELLVQFFPCILSVAVLGTIIASLGPWVLLLEVVQMALHSIINKQENINAMKKKEAIVPLNRRLDYFHRLFYMKDYAADMKSTPLSQSVLKEYSKTGKSKRNIVSSFARKGSFWSFIHEVVFCSTELIIILYLIQSIVSGRIPEVGMYMTLLLSFYRLDSKIDALTYLVKDASILSANVDKIKTFFEIPSSIESNQSLNGLIPDGGSFSIELRNAAFSYENSKFSMSDLNFTVKPGEKVAIVGENGVGKSTFVKLLLRLYDTVEGDIYINGKSIREYDVHALRQRIGVAFQNTNIYAMSFADNVSLYRQVSESGLQDVAKRLGLDSVLEKNHTDFSAELTREFHENGIMLSGGEAQKVALARVMSNDFGLLLLDEPSSALDPIAEYKMNRAILSASNKSTTIIIAHRLSTIRDADKIIVFDQGKIFESGTHDELMSLHGKYYEMFTKQAENYIKN